MLVRSPEAIQRARDAERFRWEDALMRDKRLKAAAMRFAALVRQRYRSDLGYAEISHRKAAQSIGLSERHVLRARNQLIDLGWLYRLNPPQPIANGNARYAIIFPEGVLTPDVSGC